MDRPDSTAALMSGGGVGEVDVVGDGHDEGQIRPVGQLRQGRVSPCGEPLAGRRLGGRDDGDQTPARRGQRQSDEVRDHRLEARHRHDLGGDAVLVFEPLKKVRRSPQGRGGPLGALRQHRAVADDVDALAVHPGDDDLGGAVADVDAGYHSHRRRPLLS